MIIKLNPTGTHIHKGFLKVRLDLYPEPTDKTYALHYVDEVVWDERRQEFILTGRKQLNPCLCHFTIVPETVCLEDLEAFIPKLFTPDILLTLDSYLVLPNPSHYVSPFMRNKPALDKKIVQTMDTIDLVNSINFMMANKVVDLKTGGKIIEIEPESITIGSAAINRGTSSSASTRVAGENPANDTGTIDTFKIWAASSMTLCDSATFFIVADTNLSTRDTEAIGSVTGGSEQIFSGLDIDVVTGDFIGCYFASGRIERDGTGGATGYYYTSGDLVPCTDYTFTFSSQGYLSIGGTGTEAAGGWAGEYCGVAVSEFDGVTPAEIDGV